MFSLEENVFEHSIQFLLLSVNEFCLFLLSPHTARESKSRTRRRILCFLKFLFCCFSFSDTRRLLLFFFFLATGVNKVYIQERDISRRALIQGAYIVNRRSSGSEARIRTLEPHTCYIQKAAVDEEGSMRGGGEYGEGAFDGENDEAVELALLCLCEWTIGKP